VTRPSAAGGRVTLCPALRRFTHTRRLFDVRCPAGFQVAKLRAGTLLTSTELKGVRSRSTLIQQLDRASGHKRQPMTRPSKPGLAL
jgi:hypothetical protein